MTQIIRMKATNGEGTELKQYEELFFPNADYVDPIQGIKHEFQYRRGDIIQCSYPKSGYHWIGSMLWKLQTLDDSAKPRDAIIEEQIAGAYDGQEDPRIIQTHLAPNRLYPSHIENKGKVVLMLRNPKDIAVSFYHYLKKSCLFKNKQTWDEFFQSFIQGETYTGSCFTYLQKWEQILQDVNEGKSSLEIEVFYYEDFLLNPKENIARLNKFLDFGRDEQYLNRVLHETTLDELKTRYKNFKNRVGPCSSDNEGNSITFRKGQIGDWKNLFRIAQSDLVDHLLKNTQRHEIFKFRFEL